MEILKRSFSSTLRVFTNQYCTQARNLLNQTFDNGIQKITLNDPKSRNSLSKGLMEDLLGKFKQYENDQNLRVIVLTAEGPVFSAGHNLKELTPECGRKQHEEIFHLCSVLMKTIIDCPVPVIAKVDGLAAAAGCQLAAQCDMLICSEKSSFSTPGANFGIFCSTPGIALARCMPKMPSLYMLLTGNTISSKQAYEWGLVTKVSPNDKLDEEINAICTAIKGKSRAVIELGKRFYYKQIQYDVKQAYDLGGDKMVENINLIDGKEGIKSFVEKRKPSWSHKYE